LKHGVFYNFFRLFLVVFSLVLVGCADSADSGVQTMSEDEIPETVERIYARFGNVELLGYERVDRTYFPGETVEITFYWRVLEPSEQDFTLSLDLINPFQDILSASPDVDLVLPVSTMETEQVYAHDYELELIRVINARYTFSLTVNLFESGTGNRIPVTDAQHNPIHVILDVAAVAQPTLRVSTWGLELLDAVEPESRTFGNLVRLDGFGYYLVQGDETFYIDALWQARANIDSNYVTFLHILNEDGTLITGYDFEPQFPTRYWRDEHNYRLSYIIVPPETGFMPGVYTVNFGWYERNTVQRLFIQDSPGNSTYEVFQFEVDDDGMYHLPELNISQQ